MFHELSEEIRKLPLAEQEYHPHNTTSHLLESNISFDYDPNNSFRGSLNQNPNEFVHTGSSGGYSTTGSSSNRMGLGATGSSADSQNGNGGFGMNTLQSVPESPIRRSSSPTRFRETASSSPTNVPFIPRSSTHRYLPNSPFRKAVNHSENVTSDQLGEIIKEAITSAVEAAQIQWMKELKNGTFTHPDFSGSENFHHRFAQLSSKVDILQDQVQSDSSFFPHLDLTLLLLGTRARCSSYQSC